MKLGDGWYVICGKNFGSYVSHEQGTFMHFSFDDLHVCTFKAKWFFHIITYKKTYFLFFLFFCFFIYNFRIV